jgi:pilus assembly protein Flp/PilA
MLSKMKQAVVNFVRREDGPTAVEYAVMLALILIVCIISVTSLGTNTNKAFNKASTAAS